MKVKTKEIKYPFSGIAPNLIDKFLVLGYDQKTIDFTYQNCNIDSNEYTVSLYKVFEFEERPEVVNEICYNYSKDLLDNDLILELIFPNYPLMYFLPKEFIKQKEVDEESVTNPYSIIFSINPQDNFGSKKSYNGLGYVFYILQEHKINEEIDGYLYIPAAYVILSEFPYFNQFKSLCSHIYNRVKKETDEIPIEIILYNTIRFAPSPINKNIYLIFGNQIGFSENDNIDVEKILFNLNSEDKHDRTGIPSMLFPQLSGYPYIDINMSFIFNLIPPEIIIEVFIFSFLEHDIIFYSSKPELLNMIMYIFSCFNYPFNDSIYYWHILSVSQESFMTGTSTFVGKTSSTMTGILSVYDPNIMTTKKIKEHFVLDIDNKNFFYLYQEDNDEVQETMELYTYIKNCAEFIINSKTNENLKLVEYEEKLFFPDGINLFYCIKKLLDELIRRSKKVTAIDYNKLNIRPNFFNIYENESEMLCIKSNKRLQEAFFLFIIQIMKNFVKIKTSEENSNKAENINTSNNIDSKKGQKKSKNEKKERNKKKEKNEQKEQKGKNEKNEKKEQKEKKENELNDKLALEEKRKLAKRAGAIFTEKFKDSSKYNSFVINFCQFHETIDLYRIPYNFINEFIYYSQFNFSENLNEILTFKLIDQFYGKIELLDFKEIIKKKQNEIELKKSLINPKTNKIGKKKTKKEK